MPWTPKLGRVYRPFGVSRITFHGTRRLSDVECGWRLGQGTWKGSGMSGFRALRSGAHLAGFPQRVVMNQLSVMGKVSSTAGLRLTVGGGGTPGVYVPATPDTCNVGV